MPNGSITFVSKLTLAPEVTLPEYKGITVTVPPLAVPDEEIEAQLTALQERFADFNDIEGRPAAMGDFAVIDYTSTVDGKPTEEFLGKPAGYLSGREGFWVRLDEKAFLPGFAAQLVGMNVGDSREITVTLPEDFPVADLRRTARSFSTPPSRNSRKPCFPHSTTNSPPTPRSRQDDGGNQGHHPREHGQASASARSTT